MNVLTYKECHNASHRVALTSLDETRDLNTERPTGFSRDWTGFSIDTTTWMERQYQRARVAVLRIKGIGGGADAKRGSMLLLIS